MQNVKVFGLAVLALGLLSGGAFRAADKDAEEPKYSVRDVMRQAHRKPDKNTPTLADKVITGKADKDEQAKLLELYVALTANKPAKGDADAWKERSAAITEAIKAVQSSKENAGVDLQKAMNCRACHMAHRGK